MFSVTRQIKTDHKDLIHDVAYDFFGTRMATCSSDQTVRVWEVDNKTGGWTCEASWKAHSGSVWKITWAHPEFGQVLATCSFDRTVAVWEEVVGEAAVTEKPAPGGAPRASHSHTHWVKRTTLVDSRTSVTDVKFAPKWLGLVLAACSADGFVRIYEAPDVMNLTQWSLQYEVSAKFSCSSLAWNPTYPRHFAPMIAVGSDDNAPDTSKVNVYEFSENLRRWNKIDSLGDVTEPVNDLSFAPNLGRSFHLLAVASKDLKVVSLEPQVLDEEATGGGQGQVQQQGVGVQATTKYFVKTLAKLTDHNATVWRVAWNVTGTILASSGDDGVVRLWKSNYAGNWKTVSALRGDGKMGTEAGASASVSPTFGSPVIGTSVGNSNTNSNAARLMRFGGPASAVQATGNKGDVAWH